jgi:hypothetical protein
LQNEEVTALLDLSKHVNTLGLDPLTYHELAFFLAGFRIRFSTLKAEKFRKAGDEILKQ